MSLTVIRSASSPLIATLLGDTSVRQITLLSDVASAKAGGTFEDDILGAALPKPESMKPKQIRVHPAPLIEGRAS